MTQNRYSWAAKGDVNAFFGLMLDNVANLLLTVSLLHGAFAFPTEVALRNMVPGTAIGVLVGDLLFFWLALRLAKKTGNTQVTAMPLGLDTPSTFGMVFFVLGPAFLNAKASGMTEHAAAIHTWHIGICAIFISGLFKFACALGSGWIRRMFPRAGLLGSLAAIALVLISFLPLLEILHSPIVGFVALAVVLTTLVARLELPFKLPGAVGSLLIGGAMYYLMQWAQSAHLLPDVLSLPTEVAAVKDPMQGLFPTEWLAALTFEWTAALQESFQYLPIVIPFALATVVGGIDCTESAAAAGDEFDTREVIAVEALATVVASLCGGVIQTTPYIGHPAYKAMGGRSAYVLATALFVGSAGVLGYFAFLYVIVPKVTIYPILIFIGLEITAQSFHHTPRRHYAAVAIACVPALATLGLMFVDKIFGDPTLIGARVTVMSDQGVATEVIGATADRLTSPITKAELVTLRILANGFIVTSLIWASALAALIDRRAWRAAAFFLAAGGLTLFGIMHSPSPGSPMFLPWQLEGETLRHVVQFAAGYAAVAALLLAWGWLLKSQGVAPLTDDQPPAGEREA